jgi:diguanylate cyclase (GGDEF)-like protein
MNFETPPYSKALANVLGWQSRVRIVVAGIYAAATMVLQSVGMLWGSVLAIGVTFAVYASITLITTAWAKRFRSMVDVPAAIAITADIAFLFAVTGMTSSPAYYSRVLILSFFIVHTSETYFGRAHAMLALIVASLGYVALVVKAISGGAAIQFPESLWSVLAFWATGSALVLHYGEIQRRLSKIVALFERAEQGDFTQIYDVEGERFPDAVTRVGRAYNRVQLHLSEMVLNDVLTGCLNRRGFDQALAREVARSSRAGSDLALIAIDLDDFKKVNDTYGHMGGDVMLREFGLMMAQAARAGDMVARTGGEEFSILLPDTGAPGATLVAERLCERVRTHGFVVNGRPVVLTASFGVVSTRPGRDESDANLKQRADEALYAAKDAGRNCVKMWDPSMRNRMRGPRSGERDKPATPVTIG